jgi:hypothetical protein
MKRAGAFVLTLFLAAALGGCRSSEFSTLVRAVEREPGTRRQYIPMLSLARTGVRTIHPHGIRDFQVAIFHTKGLGDPTRLDAAIASVGEGWTPMVRVSSAKGERTTVWSRPSDAGMEMLVLAHEPGESVIVRVVMDLDRFFATLNDSPGKLATKNFGGS